MIAELQKAIEDQVQQRNHEILQYILTHPTDYYHTQIKPKLLFAGDLDGEISYWSIMHHFLQVD